MVELKLPIPEEFLKEEVRCGYTVSKGMKEVWAVQLDLFAEFDRVCRKHGITYIASGGTMLGAVRHKGYIPWDDDMDLMLMRDQYDKLCEVATKEFRHPYFFQTEKTEPGSHRWFARLRNSETTAIQKIEASYHPRYNQGIFIDIFPMDSVVDDGELFHKQFNRFKYYYNCYCWFNSIENSFRSDNDTYVKKIAKSMLHLCFGGILRRLHLTQKVHCKAVAICTQYNHLNTEFVSLLSFQFDNLQHALHRSDMEDIVYFDYEFLKCL